MGRHGAPPPAASRPTPQRLRAALTTWAERAALGLAAGGGTWGVLHWAGSPSATALWAGAGIAVVVPAAAWAASTLPGHDAQRDDVEDHERHQ